MDQDLLWTEKKMLWRKRICGGGPLFISRHSSKSLSAQLSLSSVRLSFAFSVPQPSPALLVCSTIADGDVMMMMMRMGMMVHSTEFFASVAVVSLDLEG